MVFRKRLLHRLRESSDGTNPCEALHRGDRRSGVVRNGPDFHLDSPTLAVGAWRMKIQPIGIFFHIDLPREIPFCLEHRQTRWFVLTERLPFHFVIGLRRQFQVRIRCRSGWLRRLKERRQLWTDGIGAAERFVDQTPQEIRLGLLARLFQGLLSSR